MMLKFTGEIHDGEIHSPIHESIGLLKSQVIETTCHGYPHCGNTPSPNMQLGLLWSGLGDSALKGQELA